MQRVIARRGQKAAGGRDLHSAEWRTTLKKRLLVTVGIFAFWATAIEARLLYLQVFAHAEMVARAERQHIQSVEAPAKRGDIVDRGGRILATSADADSIYAIPADIKDPGAAIARLCRAFGDCTARERKLFAERLGRKNSFAYIRRRVSPEEARRVADLKLDGIGFFKESRRFYPKKELAAHLLGYVGAENTGLAGIEHAYNKHIRGEDGKLRVQTDGRGHAFSRVEKPPTAGSSIELTIDEYLQHVAERELAAGVAYNRAAGGTALIMDPRTGEILALANAPTFNPNLYGKFPIDHRRNRAVQDLYEPGSTFKVITASAAIEEKVIRTDAPIDVSAGQIRVGSRVFSDTHRYSVLTFEEVVAKSSNVGAIKVAMRLGPARLGSYVQRFGFGSPLSPDFPGESRGIVWEPSAMTELAMASVSIGYSVAVTPIQMAAAVSSVANGGDLVEPRVIRAIYQGNRRYTVQPKVIRRTMSAQTAATMTGILEGVVDAGTAKLAQIPGFTIAGKTGTARKLLDGRYSTTDYMASFVGYVPARSPAVTVIVVIDSPHGPNSRFGGPVAAPIFQRIAESTLRYLGVAPTINPAPPVIVARHRDSSLEPTSSTIPSEDEPAAERTDVVPDLHGLSARDATRRLATLGLTVTLEGDGLVIAQHPPAGTPLEEGGRCKLVLGRGPFERQEAASQP
jgi:cell division protein FtsI (penicillin-binding protein 3)